MKKIILFVLLLTPLLLFSQNEFISEKKARKILIESHYYKENILDCKKCRIVLDNTPSEKEPFYIFRIYISHKDNDEVVGDISVNAYTGKLYNETTLEDID